MISTIAMSLWFSFDHIVGFGSDFHVSLASDLALSKSNDIISGIDDIENGKIPYSCTGISADLSTEDYYVNQISNGRRDFDTSLFEAGKWDDSKVKWFQSSICPVISETSTMMKITILNENSALVVKKEFYAF
ncbi:unnamed protein product [Adineta steineri]|uniref:Uncharacterized protein n=1 Tax=Adineta steineri TaxID=433720 RepID=A0A815M3P8_9BILA|nr:unnamed protein product [Adineta steineri]